VNLKPCTRLALALTLALAAHGSQARPDLVIVVRHAERASEPATDPVLTPAGTARAEALAAALAHAGITAIFTTQLQRSRDTAAPTVAATHIKPKVIPTRPGDVPGHVREVADAVKLKTGTVLVVAHSDTATLIVAALGAPSLPELCDTSFNRVFVVRPSSPTKATVTRLSYGEPSGAPGADCL